MKKASRFLSFLLLTILRLLGPGNFAVLVAGH
jgi:hypothetical protein